MMRIMSQVKTHPRGRTEPAHYCGQCEIEVFGALFILSLIFSLSAGFGGASELLELELEEVELELEEEEEEAAASSCFCCFARLSPIKTEDFIEFRDFSINSSETV